MLVYARAKVNLFLEVKGRRSDGYHEIQSVLVPLTLADRLTIEPLDSALELVAPEFMRLDDMLDPLSLGAPDDNLALKAARLLREVTGCRRGARLTLEKFVPIAAGLGGGSADAAAALTGLNTFWGTGLSQTELMELAARLGCDVPALVHGGAVAVRGRGELVEPLAWQPNWAPWALLVNPGFGIATSDIYKRYKPDLTSTAKTSRYDNLLSALKSGDQAGLASNLFNALQSTVFTKYPLLEMIADRLTRLGALNVLLSGTGATLFALTHDAHHAKEIATELRHALECRLWSSVIQIAGTAAPV